MRYALEVRNIRYNAVRQRFSPQQICNKGATEAQQPDIGLVDLWINAGGRRVRAVAAPRANGLQEWQPPASEEEDAKFEDENNSPVPNPSLVKIGVLWFCGLKFAKRTAKLEV